MIRLLFISIYFQSWARPIYFSIFFWSSFQLKTDRLIFESCLAFTQKYPFFSFVSWCRSFYFPGSGLDLINLTYQRCYLFFWHCCVTKTYWSHCFSVLKTNFFDLTVSHLIWIWAHRPPKICLQFIGREKI